MLLVNLSREKIILQGKGFVEELEYLDIERQLPPLLIDTIEQHHISTIWVINGPGSFTTLRLGCLTLNTIQQFSPHPSPLPIVPPSSSLGEGVRLGLFEIYSCSKLDIYKYAVEQGLFPSLGLVYIGQKKNMWKVVFSQQSSASSGWQCDIINQETIGDLGEQNYFIDPCEHILLDSLERENMIDMSFDGDVLLLTYQEKSLSMTPSDLNLQLIEQVEPNYMMDPQIG